MTDISVHSTDFQVENRSWLLSPHGTEPGTTPSITLDVSAFTAETHYPDGYILSGEPLAKLGSGLYAPYAAAGAAGGDVAEVSTVTRTATGGTFNVVANGRVTDDLDAAATATAAAIQAAIRALGPEFDAVTVTGADGGPFTITWTGVADALGAAVVDVVVDDGAATGGTVVVAEATAGVAGASGAGSGLLFSSIKVPNTAVTTVDVGAALLVHGFVKVSKLPRDPGAAFWADLPLIHHVA